MADTILPKLSEESTEKGSERTIGSARMIMEKTWRSRFLRSKDQIPYLEGVCGLRITKGYTSIGITGLSHKNCNDTDCQQCMEWSKRECGVEGHSDASKRRILTNDDSEVRECLHQIRHQFEKSNQDKNNCCMRNICTFGTWKFWCSLEGMLRGAMYRASFDESKKRNGDGDYRCEVKLSSKNTT